MWEWRRSLLCHDEGREVLCAPELGVPVTQARTASAMVLSDTMQRSLPLVVLLPPTRDIRFHPVHPCIHLFESPTIQTAFKMRTSPTRIPLPQPSLRLSFRGDFLFVIP